MNKIYEGQEVYYQYIGHRPSDRREPEATVVTKVGRKWFEVERVKHERYSIETLKNDSKGYSTSSRIILSLLDYRNEQEYALLLSTIRKEFDFYNSRKFTLEQLRQIAKVLNNEQNDKRSIATEAK